MSNKLVEICTTTAAEVARRKAVVSEAMLTERIATASAPRGFRAALDASIADGRPALIAEIKRASPSKGLIREDFNPPAHAEAYQAGGASCLSVLTDVPYFQGDDAYLVAARDAVRLPALRKDFMVDPWQVREARGLGADAILVIVAALDDAMMVDIEQQALDLGMDVLIEVHDEEELARAAKHLSSRLIGVNNRDLKRFVTDLSISERLAPLMPEGTTIVSESGINGHQDILRLNQSGIHAFLVGEYLMRQQDVAAATRALLTGAAA